MARRKSRFLPFLFGIFFGIILTVGSVVGGAYWAYNNLSIQKAEQITDSNFDFLDDLLAQNASLKTMTIKQLVAEADAALNLTVDAFGDKYGIKFDENLGIVYPLLKNMKLKELPSIMSKISEISDLTYSEFDVEYPDMITESLRFIVDALPDIKIKETFDNLDVLLTSTMLGTFLGAPYNQDPDVIDPPEGETVDEFLWELRTYYMGADSDKPITSLPDNITVKRFEELFNMQIPTYLMSEDDKAITMLTGLSDTLSELTFIQILEEPDAADTSVSAKIIRKIRALTIYDAELDGSEEYPGGNRPYRVSEMNDMFSALTNTLTMDVFLTSPTEAGLTKVIIDKLIDQGSTVNTLSSDISSIVEDLKFSDVFDIEEPEPGSSNPGDRILFELKDYYIKDAGSALSNLTLQAVLGQGNTGTGSNIGERIIYALVTAEDGDGNPYTISGIEGALSGLLLKDIFDSGSPDGDVGDRILYAITRQQDPLNPDSFFRLDQLDDALNALTVGVIFPEGGSTGVASLLTSAQRNAPLSDIDSVVLDAIMNSPLDNLLAAGIISSIPPFASGSETLNDVFS